MSMYKFTVQYSPQDVEIDLDVVADIVEESEMRSDDDHVDREIERWLNDEIDQELQRKIRSWSAHGKSGAIARVREIMERRERERARVR